eukprot:9181873-Alexandrium_andersonii.AAC.1
MAATTSAARPGFFLWALRGSSGKELQGATKCLEESCGVLRKLREPLNRYRAWEINGKQCWALESPRKAWMSPALLRAPR